MPSPLTIQPDPTAGKDNRLRSAAATTNYGTLDSLQIGYAYSKLRGVIAFDISGVPAAATVTGVTLSLYEHTAATTGTAPASWAMEVHRLLRDWSESQSTWNEYATGAAWGTAGAMADSDRTAAASASLTLDATAAAAFVDWTGSGLVSDVTAWKAGTASNYGWLIHADASTVEGLTGGNGAYNTFYSSDYATDAAKRPKLVVDYTAPSYLPGVMRTHIIGRGVYVHG